MKIYALFLGLLFCVAGFAQPSLNGYKYVIVPEKYDFSKEPNQYGLNSTTRSLLESKGFVVFLGNEQLPPAVALNKCYALVTEVVQRTTMFTTNLTLSLKDCQGNVVFKSKEGKSREKEYPVAYDEALRNAFASLNAVPYKYDSTLLTQQAVPVGLSVAPAPAAPVPAAPVPTAAPVSGPAPAPGKPVGEISGTLYAQATATGFQLVDLTPKKVLSLLKTSVSDYYIAEAGSAYGVVFKKDNVWYFEHYENGKLISQKLEIKF